MVDASPPVNPCKTCPPGEAICCTRFDILMPFLTPGDMRRYMGDDTPAHPKNIPILDAIESTFSGNHPEGFMTFTPVIKVINGFKTKCCPFLRILKNRVLCRIYEDRPEHCRGYRSCGKFPGEEKMDIPARPAEG